MRRLPARPHRAGRPFAPANAFPAGVAMTLGLKCRLLDLGFVTVVLFVLAVPLLMMRFDPLFYRPEGFAVVTAMLGAMAAVWAYLARRDSNAEPAASAARLGWWRTALLAAVLAGVVYVNFYRPLQIQFWCGADDFVNLLDEPLPAGLEKWDRCA